MYFYDSRRVISYHSYGGRTNTLVALIICLGYFTYAFFILDMDEQEIGYHHQYYSISSSSYSTSNEKYGYSNINLEKRIIFQGSDGKESDESKARDRNEHEKKIEAIKLPSHRTPSHILMCKHLIPRLEYALSKHSLEMKAETLGLNMKGLDLSNIPEFHVNEATSVKMDYTLVEEDQSICMSQESPMDSLKRIFSSTLLSIVSTKFQLNVEYRHQCNLGRGQSSKGEIKNTNFTIQEMLPDDFSDSKILLEDMSFDVLAIKNMCRDCMKSLEDKTSSYGDNCVLFAGPTNLRAKPSKSDENQIHVHDGSKLHTHTSHGLSMGVETMLPLMKSIFFQVALSWKNEYANHMINASRLQFHPPLAQVSKNQIYEPKASLDHESDENSILRTQSWGDIVIYIACIDEDCDRMKDSIALPFEFYREKISSLSEVSSISVLISHSCAAKVDGCLSYGQALFTLFVQYFTEIQIELIETNSSYHAYSLMILADYLICPPTDACFLPAILSPGQSMLATSGYDLEFVSLLTNTLIYDTNLQLFTDSVGKSVMTLDHAFLAGIN